MFGSCLCWSLATCIHKYSVVLRNSRLFIQLKVPVLGTKVCTLKHINYFLRCNFQGGVIATTCYTSLPLLSNKDTLEAGGVRSLTPNSVKWFWYPGILQCWRAADLQWTDFFRHINPHIFLVFCLCPPFPLIHTAVKQVSNLYISNNKCLSICVLWLLKQACVLKITWRLTYYLLNQLIDLRLHWNQKLTKIRQVMQKWAVGMLPVTNHIWDRRFCMGWRMMHWITFFAVDLWVWLAWKYGILSISTEIL